MLAQFYDEVMDHVNYRAWASYIDKMAVKKHGLRRGRAIDFACGTGTLLTYLARLGWDTVGVDASSPMVEEAKAIKPPRGRVMQWGVYSFLETPDVEPCDLGICVYDSLNYLLDEEEVATFFRNARQVIRPGGLLVVDLSTEINSRIHFNGSAMEEHLKGGSYRRITRYDEEERIQHNVFNIYPDGEDTVYVEHHQQRIYMIQTVLDIAKENGFQPKNVYHELTFKPGDETSDRIHIAAEPV